MIRYRCPHCAALIVAHERRAGQSSVCKACFKPHAIPADESFWLNEAGERLHPPAAAPPAPESVPLPLELARPAVEDRDALAPTVPEIQLPEPLEPVPPSVAPVVREPEPVAVPVPIVNPGPVRSPRPVPRVTRSVPSAPAGRTEHANSQSDDATVATATPPPAPAPALRSRPVPAPRVGRFVPAPVPPSADRREAPGEPVQLQTQADIAVALTAALTTRMKPPAAPRRDLRPSTAVWMLLTGLGGALALLAVFNDPDYRWAALAVAAVQIACGYAWIVRLTHLRDPKRALLCAVPPLTLLYLVQYKYAKLRPLRFVATGAVLVGLAAVAPALHASARALVGRNEPAPVVSPNPAERSKLEQLRVYRERQSYDPLMKLLDVLAKTDPLLSEDARDRAALAVELKGLCQHVDTAVKVRAMAAYARWDPDGARGVCLAAVKSPTPEEREWALRLLPQWKDAESARAVGSLIGIPGRVETNRAKLALEEIGGVPAEQAAIALFNRADDQGTKLAAVEILEKVGGSEAVAWLRVNSKVVDDTVVRARALSAADSIEARIRPPAP